MVGFSDLDALLYGPTEPCNMNTSPLLDVQNEEEAKLDALSPIDSPGNEVLVDFPASELEVRPKKLAGSLPAAPKFPQVSPLSHTKTESSPPSKFGLENLGLHPTAQAFVPEKYGSYRGHVPQLRDAAIHMEQALYLRGHSECGQSEDKRANQEKPLQSLRSKYMRDISLSLPTDKRLERRQRWEITISQCLRFLPEDALMEITRDILSQVSQVEPQVLEQLASWAATLNNKSSEINLEVPKSSLGLSSTSNDQVERVENPFGEISPQYSPSDMTESTSGKHIHAIQSLARATSGPDPLASREEDGIPSPLHIKLSGGIGKSSRKIQSKMKKTARRKSKITVPETENGSRYLHTWKQTLALKEARENAAKSKAKRKRDKFERDTDERSCKRQEVIPNSNVNESIPMSNAASYNAQRHLNTCRRKKEKREDAGNEQSSDVQNTLVQDSASNTKASQFCHLCTRRAKSQVLLVCQNVSRGTCRKVICFRCAEEQNWSVQAILEAKNWTCTHCRKVCPKRAQCHTYKRVNQHRKGDGRRFKKCNQTCTVTVQDPPPDSHDVG